MRLFFITLSAIITSLITHGQDHAAATRPGLSNLSELFGGAPFDSSYDLISAWCRANGFHQHDNPASPYKQVFRKEASGDARFDYPPDSIYSFFAYTYGNKRDTTSHVLPNFSFSLIYFNDLSGKALKEFKILQDLFRKWTGNSHKSLMNDRYDTYRKWRGVVSWMTPYKKAPMLNLTYAITNDHPERTVVTVFYLREPMR